MSAFRALRHPDFALYFSGQLVSWVGTWMQTVALGWWVHRLTGQPAWLGIVAFASQAPSFLLGPLGGALADRWASHRLVLATQAILLLQAVAMTWLAWSGQATVGMIVGLAILLGLVNALDLPGRQVLMALTVPKPDLPNAIALNSALFHGSRIVGPALAGLILAVSGEAACFGVNALSYLASLGTLAFVRAGRIPPPPAHQTMLANLTEGIGFIGADLRLRHLMVFMGLVVFLGMPYTALIPVFADTILHAGPKGVGLLMGAGGIGATLAALTLATLKDPQRLPRIMAASTLLFAGFLTAFAFSKHMVGSMLLLGGSSFFLVITNTGNNTLINLLIPQALRGRIMSLYNMVFVGAMPAGALLAGLAAQGIGAPWALAAGAVGCLLATLHFAWRYPKA